jgi:hypothetical protein
MEEHKERIKDGMSIITAMDVMSDKNPGAVQAMIELVMHTEKVDPDSLLGAWQPIAALDSAGIYGPEIWILYKDNCQCDVLTMLAVLRAYQLGIITQKELKTATSTQISNPIAVEHLNQIMAKVMDRLPKFNRGGSNVQ